MRQAKIKLAVLDTPGFGQVLFDALHTYIGDARGEEVDVQHIAEMADVIVYSLRRRYLAELPAKEPAVKNRDLEDLIDEVKGKKECKHPDIKSDGGGDYCNKCGKRWSR